MRRTKVDFSIKMGGKGGGVQRTGEPGKSQIAERPFHVLPHDGFNCALKLYSFCFRNLKSQICSDVAVPVETGQKCILLTVTVPLPYQCHAPATLILGVYLIIDNCYN